ncbi:MAG: 2'-5' RNA ligase family protein [Ferruginibacter sp.]
MDAPLIITLKLDDETQFFFNRLRQEHFPKHVNYLEAHCTLFHKLPASEPIIRNTLAALSQRPAFSMKVAAVKNIGNGVVYTIESGELGALHKSLQESFAAWLTNQDRQTLNPHITIQNKVTAFKALTLYEQLKESFVQFDIKAVGISTFLYLNGPWQHVEDFTFK